MKVSPNKSLHNQYTPLGTWIGFMNSNITYKRDQWMTERAFSKYNNTIII